MNSLAPYPRNLLVYSRHLNNNGMILTSDVLRNKVGVSTSTNSMHESYRDSTNIVVTQLR